jgi:large subunit ribosomal protein L14e
MIMPLKRLSLTKMKVPIQRGARTGTLAKAVKKMDLASKWAETPFAKKLAMRTTRANLSDLERFQVMVNRKRRSLAIKKTVKAISKPAGKQAAAPAKAAPKQKGGKKK